MGAMEKLNILQDVDFKKLYEESKKIEIRSNNEQDDYSSFEFTHGYGMLYKAGVSVEKGVSATVNVSIKISTFSKDFYTNTTNEMRNTLDSKVTEHLDESTSQSNFADWWFWLFSANESDYNHHKDSQTESVNTTDTTVSNSLKKNFSTNKQDYEITGTFTVVGQSQQPTTAYLFVEMLQIKTKDGSTTTVINSSPIAADDTGDTSKVSIDSDKKLNILPL